MDTWILVRNMESNGERNRALYVLKARGMAHSAQVREFRLSDRGIELLDVVVGPEGVMVGSARSVQQARDHTATLQRQAEIVRKQRLLERKRRVIESQITALQAEIEAEEEQINQELAQEVDYQNMRVNELKTILQGRQEYGAAQEKEGK
jgi:circadian clock protein KaiC